MNNLLKLTLFAVLIVFTLSNNTYCQVFHINEKNNLEISLEDYLDARINGAVRLRDIRYPDDNFDVLKPLGEPRAKDQKIHEDVGETITFKYIGFELHYSALSQPEFVLQGIHFYEGAELLLNNGNRIRAETPFKSHIKGLANVGINFADQDKIKVDVPEDDGAWIKIIKEEGIIKKMIFYF